MPVLPLLIVGLLLLTGCDLAPIGEMATGSRSATSATDGTRGATTDDTASSGGAAGGIREDTTLADAAGDVPSAAGLPVIPGAAGFGIDTPAGRGGRIIAVTTLDDAGRGSLRAALEAEGPRIVVFEVAGTITLTSDLIVRNPFVTIAGQTAPGPGITLRGAGLRVRTHDALVQHLRIRAGDSRGGPDPEIRDSVDVSSTRNEDVHHVVIDHVSAAWSTDENTSTWGAVRDVTFQNSIIAEGLLDSLHPEGAHSMGLLVGDHSKRVSVIGNLFAHNNQRNPLFKGDTSGVVANNVIYDPGQYAIHVSDRERAGAVRLSVLGNVIRSGASTRSMRWLRVSDSVPGSSRIFVRDNVVDDATAGWSAGDVARDVRSSTAPVRVPGMRVVASGDVQRAVLSTAGARPCKRDDTDARIVEQTRRGRGSIVDSPPDERASRSDERTLALPADPHGDADGDGYTNVEEWLHELDAAVSCG